MAEKSRPSAESKKPGRSVKEKRQAKHQKQAEQKQARKGWDGKSGSRPRAHGPNRPDMSTNAEVHGCPSATRTRGSAAATAGTLTMVDDRVP